MPDYKAIVIDVEAKSTPQGVGNKWEDITTHMPILTRDIKTPALDSDSDLSSVVSGMPTVFARANLFKLAIDYIQKSPDERGQSGGLMDFYSNLVDEWRGFIACIALDYSRIEVRRIKLAYSDGKDIIGTENLYEPKGAFGNMLFERKGLWAMQGPSAIGNNDPFIDVIMYGGDREEERNVVGATSPESLLFTSPSYKVKTQHPFVNSATGKFTDPLKNRLEQDEALSLLAYVERIENQINNLEKYYKELDEDIRPNYSTVQGNIRTWKDEIKKYCTSHNYDLDAKSIPPVQKFSEPYNLVFNYSSKLYGLEGIIYDDESSAPDNKIFFDPKDILLPKNSEIARIDFSNSEITRNPSLLAEQPVYVLKAQIKGKDNEFAYFALPITPLGLNVFGKNIGALTGVDSDNSNDIPSKLVAVYDQDAPIDNLEVVLQLTTNSKRQKSLKESYTVKKDRISNKDIMLWPNFISDNWNRYFLYSELPHNTVSQNCPFKAVPIVGTSKDNDFRIIVDEETKEPVVLAHDGKVKISERTKRETGLEAKFHVVSDNRVSDNNYKYEIYESNLPFKGVKLSAGNKESGYLVIRYTMSDSENIPKNELGLGRQLVKATVGIDFGSTNTSVAYMANNIPHGIKFKNHRISLLQAGRVSACKERDLFFFQAKEIEGNSIKSILTLNDQRRLVTGDFNVTAREVSGGMPCFDPSLLPVDNVTDNRILLKCADIGQIHLVHNMKWTTSDGDIANKKAFLRSLMLHIYAQLYTDGCVPTMLKWSYPSSMNVSLVNQYSQIWNDLKNGLSPVVGYGLDVCASDLALNIPADGETGWGDNASSNANGWGSMATNADSWGAMASDGGWGTASEEDNGWGDSVNLSAGNSQEGGWNTNQKGNVQAEEDLKPDTNEIDFNFQTIPQDKCMTEACAVANFMNTQSDIDTNPNTLTLCFDVGGSTTDISALLKMLQNGLTMIKQNSIRFAAQRVTNAARKEPNLKKVLLGICKQYNIRIPGLNLGPEKYTQDTAAFYFEQVLDRTPNDGLQTLYGQLSSSCPNLMAVNMYVTGLIVYYAGQITNKLVKVIRTSLGKDNDYYAHFKPKVNVRFAGKGSRIFEWLSTTMFDAAKGYYSGMYIRGIGGMNIAQTMLFGPPVIQLSHDVSTEVKYEVSKGLVNANEPIRAPKDNMETIEVLGEDNFIILRASDYEKIPLPFDNAITPQMMAQMGRLFMQERPQSGFACNKFADFAFLFFQAASKLFGLKLTQQDFMEGFATMNIENYIQNLPEYRRAKEETREGKFDFVAPIIIFEGMKFYDQVLMNKL